MSTTTYTDTTAPPVRPGTLAEGTPTGVVRREGRVALTPFIVVDAGKDAVHRRLMRYSITALRISVRIGISGSRGIHMVTNDG
jgi:hypothetical protein